MKLTEEEARFAMTQVGRWLAIKKKETGQDATQADADHSSLLHRLLRGMEPLPERPEKKWGYPVYHDWPYPN